MSAMAVVCPRRRVEDVSETITYARGPTVRKYPKNQMRSKAAMALFMAGEVGARARKPSRRRITVKTQRPPKNKVRLPKRGIRKNEQKVPKNPRAVIPVLRLNACVGGNPASWKNTTA